METPTHLKVQNGNLIFSVKVMNGEASLGELQASISIVNALEEIAKATPTDLDNKALPFLKLILGTLESKE